MSDEEPSPVPLAEARGLSLEARVRDPRQVRERGSKHRLLSDSMSIESGSNAKKVDQTKSAEKVRK